MTAMEIKIIKSDKESSLGVLIRRLFVLNAFEDHNVVKGCDYFVYRQAHLSIYNQSSCLQKKNAVIAL